MSISEVTDSLNSAWSSMVALGHAASASSMAARDASAVDAVVDGDEELAVELVGHVRLEGVERRRSSHPRCWRSLSA